jgi:hypothetical protein
LFNLTIEKYKNTGYNDIEAGEMALKQFEDDGFIKWRKWDI